MSLEEIRKQVLAQEEDDEEEEGDENRGGMSPFLRLLKTRTILITDTITMKQAERVMTALLLLESDDPEKPVDVFINSPGGDADAGFAIFDMLRFVEPPVRTICAGLAASAAVIVLLAGDKDKRFALPNGRVMIHQPSSGVAGTASDIQIEAAEILRYREKINKLIARETGQPEDKVERDTRRNFWMSAEEAKEYGLVGKIIENRKDLA